MEIYTIGFTKRSASQFFEALRKAEIKQLVDVRLNNISQLAGFTKREDLAYFLREICHATYLHEPLLAPTREMLSSYKKLKTSSWEQYEREFLALMSNRKIETVISPDLFQQRSVLLCSEYSPKMCHRRLVAEYLKEHWVEKNVQITHL